MGTIVPPCIVVWQDATVSVVQDNVVVGILAAVTIERAIQEAKRIARALGWPVSSNVRRLPPAGCWGPDGGQLS